MKIANLYSHLNGYEYLLVHRSSLIEEITNAIHSIDANQYTKISKAKPTSGRINDDQKAINKQFESILFPLGWKSVTTPYYVTENIETAREISNIRDKDEQKRIIENKGFQAFRTNNQVDFVKDRVAVEVHLESISALHTIFMLSIRFSF